MRLAGFVLRTMTALLLLAVAACSPPASKAPLPPTQTASPQQNNPAPEPSPPAPAPPPQSGPTGGGAAAPEQSAGSSYDTGEYAGGSYPPVGASSGAGGGPGVAYDTSPEGAAPPTASAAETAAPQRTPKAKAARDGAAQRAAAEQLAAELAANEQARRAVEGAQAEENDRTAGAKRSDEQAGTMEGSGGAGPQRRVGSAVIGTPAKRAAAAPHAAFALPDFPWPPPTPSDRMLLPRAGFARGLGANPSLSDAAGRLTDALQQAGYSQYSFYGAPGGFALVARLERIRPDGTPEPEAQRFAPPSASAPFSLGSYLKQLFIAPEGYYRLIVFVVTDNVVVTHGAAPTAATTEAWLRNGADRLPPAYATLPFTKAHEVDALIYEFRKQGKGPATALLPSPLDARAHLQKAGLYSLLAGGAGH